MASYTSREGVFGFGVQGTTGTEKGTAATTPVFMKADAYDVNPNQTWGSSGAEIGGNQWPDDAVKLGYNVLGGATLKIRPRDIGYLLWATLGAKEASGEEAPYTHTFSPSTALPWITLWKTVIDASGEGSDFVQKFTDCKIDRAVFTLPAAGIPTVAFTFVGITAGGVTTAEAESFETTAFLTTCQGSCTFNDAWGKATNIVIEVTNGLTNNEFIIGYPYLDDITETTRTVRVTYDMRIQSASLYNEIYHGATDGTTWSSIVKEASLTAKIQSPEVAGGSTYYSLQFYMPKLSVQTFPVNLTGGDLITGRVTCEGLWDSVTSKILDLTLVNATASYAGD